MKIKIKWGAAALVVALVFAMGYSYFHISGRKIASFAAINEDCEVEIVRHDSLDKPAFREYTLTGPRIMELKQLLEGSSYTRRLTFLDGVSYKTVSYSIYVYFDGRQEVLFLNCMGKDQLFVSSSFEERDRYELKFGRRDWRDALEGILASAQMTSA